MLSIRLLSIEPPDPARQLHILGHYRHPLTVYRAQVAVLEQRHEVRLGRLLQREYRAALPPVRRPRHAVLYLAHEPRERQPSEEEGRRRLILPYLAQCLLPRSHSPLAPHDDARARVRGAAGAVAGGGQAGFGLVAGTGASEERLVPRASLVGRRLGSGHDDLFFLGITQKADWMGIRAAEDDPRDISMGSGCWRQLDHGGTSVEKINFEKDYWPARDRMGRKIKRAMAPPAPLPFVLAGWIRTRARFVHSRGFFWRG